MSATILVLEDDLVLQELLRDVLQDEGYRVVAAPTLPLLLNAAPRHADLLITDLLVGSDAIGLRAITELRQVTRPALPALICSAAQRQLEELQPEILRLNAQLLEKPFSIDELVALVSRAIGPAGCSDVDVSSTNISSQPLHSSVA